MPVLKNRGNQERGGSQLNVHPLFRGFAIEVKICRLSVSYHLPSVLQDGILLFKCLFVLMRERLCLGEGQRERERIPSKFHAVSTEPTRGLNPPTMKSGFRHLTNWATQGPLQDDILCKDCVGKAVEVLILLAWPWGYKSACIFCTCL